MSWVPWNIKSMVPVLREKKYLEVLNEGLPYPNQQQMQKDSSVHQSRLKVINSSGRSQSLYNSKETSQSLDEPDDYSQFQEYYEFPDCELTRGFSQKYNENNEIDKEAFLSSIRSEGESKIEKYQSEEFELLVPSKIHPKMMQSVLRSRIR